MKYIFIASYIIVGLFLFIVTPYDLQISQAVCKDIHLTTHIISELGYVPPFFIGYFGIFYYVLRFRTYQAPMKIQHVIYVIGAVGIVLLTIMFFHSMRFLPYYKIITPIFIVLISFYAIKLAKFTISMRWFEFDHLAITGLGLIVSMYFLVNVLKKVYGRARYYLVVDNNDLFTDWFVIQKGMAEHRDYYSMPSGHIAFVAISLWFILVLYAIPEIKINRGFVVAAVYIWLIIQGYIRVVMSEHFVTDVLFSTLFAIFVLNLGHLISVKLKCILFKNALIETDL